VTAYVPEPWPDTGDGYVAIWDDGDVRLDGWYTVQQLDRLVVFLKALPSVSTEVHEPWPGTWVLEQRAAAARDAMFWRVLMLVLLVLTNVVAWW
jgi:hypothetical protein